MEDVLLVRTSCQMHLNKFPFDDMECYLHLEAVEDPMEPTEAKISRSRFDRSLASNKAHFCLDITWGYVRMADGNFNTLATHRVIGIHAGKDPFYEKMSSCVIRLRRYSTFYILQVVSCWPEKSVHTVLETDARRS